MTGIVKMLIFVLNWARYMIKLYSAFQKASPHVQRTSTELPRFFSLISSLSEYPLG